MDATDELRELWPYLSPEDQEEARCLAVRFTPSRNPYATSFLRFLQDCIYTIDEARAGEVRSWPRGAGWDELWRDWEAVLLTCSPLLVDKTRRVMATNVCAAFDLWIAAGGQDSRWPALMLGTSHRGVILQSKKLEDKGGSADFVDRIAIMARLAIERGLRERWPDFPEWKWSFGNGRASNGGWITAVPQGAEQVRGAGATLIHMEELSAWDHNQARESVSNALPALHAAGGGGHLIAVTTPRAAGFAKEIRNGTLRRG